MASKSHPTRTLIIDDDEMSRELLAILLAGEGYAVVAAESGEAALDLLHQSKSAPDLMLTDIQLPGISGADLASELRAACGPATLLLAMSGSRPAAAVLVHFDGFLLKPFQMQEVAAAIKGHKAAGKTSGSIGLRQSKKTPAKSPSSAPAPSRKRRTSSVSPRPRPAATQTLPNASNNSMIATMQAGAEAGIETNIIGTIPVLNETIFQQLSRTMLSSQMKEMYMLCLSDARQRIAGMRKLAAEHNGIQFVREAHAIKGGSGMLGATEIHRKAAELEANGLAPGAQGGAQDVNSLDELNAACDRLESMLGARL